jgi:cation diffusion facilitator family transporter
LWLSIGAAVATISLKTFAWLVTGSVGLLSDAAESVVNLVAAMFALVIVAWTARPPDEEHAYGHEKADYLSAGVEGALILLAAISIAYSSIGRLLSPEPITDVALGVAVSVVASAINLSVARLLIREGRTHRSLTLEADGRHLMTDVWTSVGVVVGVVAVAVTGWERLDPIIGLAVAANIVVTGVSLIRNSVAGLMDRALPADEIAQVREVLDRYESEDVRFHALRTRRAGRRTFVSLHVLVPGTWTVQRGHNLVERIEAGLRELLDPATIFTHLEPIEDPASFEDTRLDRISRA